MHPFHSTQCHTYTSPITERQKKNMDSGLRKSCSLSVVSLQRAPNFSPLSAHSSSTHEVDEQMAQLCTRDNEEMFKSWHDEEVRAQQQVFPKLSKSLCYLLYARCESEEEIKARTYLLHPQHVALMLRCGWVQEFGVFCAGGRPFDCDSVLGESEYEVDGREKTERGFVCSRMQDGMWRKWRHHELVRSIDVSRLEGRVSPLLVTDMHEEAKEKERLASSSVGEEELLNYVIEGKSDQVQEMDEEDDSVRSAGSTKGAFRLSQSMDDGLFGSRRSRVLRLRERKRPGSPSDPRSENIPNFDYLPCVSLVGQPHVPGEHQKRRMMQRLVLGAANNSLRKSTNFEELRMNSVLSYKLVDRHTLHISRLENTQRCLESMNAVSRMLNRSYGTNVFECEEIQGKYGCDVKKMLEDLCKQGNMQYTNWRIGIAGTKSQIYGNKDASVLMDKLARHMDDSKYAGSLMVVDGFSAPDLSKKVNDGRVLMFRFVYGPIGEDGRRDVWPGKCGEGASRNSGMYALGPISVEFNKRLPTGSILNCHTISRLDYVDKICAALRACRLSYCTKAKEMLTRNSRQGVYGPPIVVRPGCEHDEEKVKTLLSERLGYAIMCSCRIQLAGGVSSAWNVGVFHANSQNLDKWIDGAEALCMFDVGLGRVLRDGERGRRVYSKRFCTHVSTILAKSSDRFSRIHWVKKLVYRRGESLSARGVQEEGFSGFLVVMKNRTGKLEVTMADYDERKGKILLWDVSPKGVVYKTAHSSVHIEAEQVVVVMYRRMGSLSAETGRRNARVARFQDRRGVWNMMEVRVENNQYTVRDYLSGMSVCQKKWFVVSENEVGQMCV